MSTELLKITEGNTPIGKGDLQQLSAAEEKYVAHLAGVEYNLYRESQDLKGQVRIGSASNAYGIGTISDTKYNQPVGTHPETNITSTTTTTEFLTLANGGFGGGYSKTNIYGTIANRPLVYGTVDDKEGLHEVNDADLDTIGNRINGIIASEEYAGSLRLADSTFDPTETNWEKVLVSETGTTAERQIAFEDSRTDGTKITYHIWRKKGSFNNLPTGATQCSIAKLDRLNNVSQAIVDTENLSIKPLSEVDLAYVIGQRCKHLRGESGNIGTYLIKSGSQGTPTETGTWVSRGTATDTRNEKIDQNHIHDRVSSFVSARIEYYTKDFTGTYTRYYVGNYIGDFVDDFAGNFVANYAGDYQSTYVGDYNRTNIYVDTTTFTGDYIANFVGDFTANFAGNYVGNFQRNYVGNFQRDVLKGYADEIAKNFVGNYTGLSYNNPFTGNYTGDFLGSTNSIQFTGNYIGDYTRFSTRTSVLGYNQTPYTGEFSSITRTKNSNFVSTRTRTRTSNRVTSSRLRPVEYTGNYERIRLANFTGNFTRDFAGNYQGVYVNNFFGNYAGDFAGNYVGNFTGNYAGDYIHVDVNYYTGGYNSIRYYVDEDLLSTRVRSSNRTIYKDNDNLEVITASTTFTRESNSTRLSTGIAYGGYVSDPFTRTRHRSTRTVWHPTTIYYAPGTSSTGGSQRTVVCSYTANLGPFFTGNYIANYIPTLPSYAGDYIGNQEYVGYPAFSRTNYFTGNYAMPSQYYGKSVTTSKSFLGNYTRVSTRTSILAYASTDTRTSNRLSTRDISVSITKTRTRTRTSVMKTINYTGDFSQINAYVNTIDYSGNYSRIFAGNFVGDYTSTHVLEYSRNFHGDYVRVFTGNYGGNYQNSVRKTSVRVSTREGIRQATSVRVRVSAGDSIHTYVGDYTRYYVGNFIKNRFRDSTNFVEYTSTRTRTLNYSSTELTDILKDFTGDFAGNFSRTMQYNSTSTSTRTSTRDYIDEDSSTRVFVRDDEETRFEDYIGAYTGDFAKDYASTRLEYYAGDYIGSTIQSGTYENVQTYTLYVRTA